MTITYGTNWPSNRIVKASGGIALAHCANGLCSAEPNSPIVTASRMGPTTITLKYSVKRRAKLRGRSTRHTKLKLASTF